MSSDGIDRGVTVIVTAVSAAAGNTSTGTLANRSSARASMRRVTNGVPTRPYTNI